MSNESILTKISGFTDGGNSTAKDLREVLTDVVETYSGYTPGVTTATLDDITTNGNTTTNDISIDTLSARTIQFDTTQSPNVVEGEMGWDVTLGTVSLGMKGGNVTQQIGEEMYIRIKANGRDLPNGSLVKYTDVVGGSGVLRGDLFNASGSTDELYVLGVATEDISSNNNGYITTFGVVRGVSTDGSNAAIEGQVWSEGDILYAGTVDGKLTNVPPTPPFLTVPVAVVLTAHANNGTIFVRPDSGCHINELHDVLTNGLAQDKDLLIYSADTKVWISRPFSFLGDYSEIVTPPTLSGDTGTPNQIAYDADYFYVCVAPNEWKRTPLSGW